MADKQFLKGAITGVLCVSLVLGGGHSIGVPMAVSADYSFIVPSATMVVHPVRQNGMFIGVAQSYSNMEKLQDRIIAFVSGHSHITAERMEELMLDTSKLVNEVGTMLEGEEAVKEGLIDEVGGIREARDRLYTLIERKISHKYPVLYVAFDDVSCIRLSWLRCAVVKNFDRKCKSTLVIS